jgi:osmotically inducible lipoprotein OsmB
MKALALIVAVAISLSGCTTMQEAVSGGAAGGVAGFALAGPIGAGVGGAGGAIMTPMMAR